MKQYLAAVVAITLAVSSSARAEISTVQWQDMNADFQAAYIQGLLAAVSTFGVTDYLRDPVHDAMECLVQRKWTADEIVHRFAVFLKHRPDLNKQPLPMAFLDYLLEVCDLTK